MKDIYKENGRWKVRTEGWIYECDRVILANGSSASQVPGSDGSGYAIAENLGHRIIRPLPALTGLRCRGNAFSAWAGVRTEGEVTLLLDGKPFCKERGELQLTASGISGIPVFQISRYATRALADEKHPYVLIDFAPDLTDKEFFDLLSERFYENTHGKSAGEALIGLFNRKLSEVLLSEAGIRSELYAGEVARATLHRLVKCVKNFRVDITGSNGMEAAQVCAGGVDTEEIEATTLASKLADGIIDIDGTCGGYNLQWAWSSGFVAGMHAAEEGMSEQR